MKRVRFNLTGFDGLMKGEQAPVLRINFADAETACVFHTLQMATDSEVRKFLAGEDEDGVVHDLISGVKALQKSGGVENARAVVQKATLVSAPVPVVMARYDSEEVCFTGSFDGEDEAVEALVEAVGLVKADFDFDVQVSEGVVLFLRAVVKSGDVSNWVAKVSGTRLRVTRQETPPEGCGELGGLVLNVVPQRKAFEPVAKVDFSPFKTLSDFSQAVVDAVGPHVFAGEFGMAQYRVDGGDLEEMPPRWWYVVEIGSGWLIVEVELGEAEERCVQYRVGYVVGDGGAVEIKGPFERVFREQVWVREDEVATVRPVAEGEPPATVQDPAGESSETGEGEGVEARSREPYGVPTKKFCVVKMDFQEAAQESAEKRYVLGVVLEPNDGIDAALNPDTQGDVYSAADIAKAAHKWMSEYLNVGLMHASLAGRRIVPVESFIAPVDMQLGEQKIVKGTWLLGAIVEDPGLWEAVKSGQLTGWSMGGYAVREPL